MDVGGSGDGNRQAASDGSRSEPVSGDEPLRVGGDLQPPAKLRHVKPEYPSLARVTGVHGTVVLECTIDAAGNVIDVRLISGHPLLAPAAIAAVGRWRYSSTRLNGQPVAVLLTVTLRFDLAR
jgi:protein TonB